MKSFSYPYRWALAILLTGAATLPAQPGTTAQQQQLPPAQQARITAAIQQVVTDTGVPSVSVGIAQHGSVVYAQAFGSAVLTRKIAVASTPEGETHLSERTLKTTRANATMAYPIGSISKQFTASCILLLEERGKLRLDDPVSRWFPNLTRANEVTVRNLLTHTSGYSDYAPQDYTIPLWTKPVDPTALATAWASKPLDFAPGTKWEYSNTNFVLAALIVEKASGQKFHDFLWQNVIEPLHLQGVLDLDTDRAQLQVHGYERHALGPLRPALLEAPGWYYGDAQLAMPVTTLLAWDESIVHRTLLKPGSYDAMETEFRLKDGTGSGYGLGIDVTRLPSGKHMLSHSGEVGGFVSNNVVILEDDLCYAALTNQEARIAAKVTTSVADVLGVQPAAKKEPAAPPANTTAAKLAEAQAQTILTSLQEADLDPSLFTADANAYFSPETIDDYSKSLAPLGDVRSVKQTKEELRGGMVFRAFTIEFPSKTLSLTTYTQPTGMLEQFIVGP